MKTGEESCAKILRERAVLAVGRIPVDGEVPAKAVGSDALGSSGSEGAVGGTLGWCVVVVGGRDEE